MVETQCKKMENSETETPVTTHRSHRRPAHGETQCNKMKTMIKPKRGLQKVAATDARSSKHPAGALPQRARGAVIPLGRLAKH